MAGSVGSAIVTDTPVSNGSVIEVHSGKARVQLVSGGSIYICGPAKVSLFDHDGALTLALEFGSIHVTQPGNEPLRIFTPFFAAMPEAMAGSSREFTVGLQQSGRLCVRAERGGVRLEQQLTGNVLTVPEPTEIFLEGGGITAQKNDLGHCVCEMADSDLALPVAPAEENAVAETPSGVAGGATVKPSSEAPPSMPSPAAGAELGVPARSAPADSNSATAMPTESAVSPPAVYKVEAPPLTYSYKLPNPPPDVNAETVLLVREAHVEGSRVFHGYVGAKALTTESGASNTAPASENSTAATSASAPATKPRGFWSKVKHFFGSGKSAPTS